MIYALDVGYHNNIARVASIGFKNWGDSGASYKNISYLKDIAPYEAGAFYKRELPSLLFALNSLDDIETIIIDGYVWLEEPKRLILNMHGKYRIPTLLKRVDSLTRDYKEYPTLN